MKDGNEVDNTKEQQTYGQIIYDQLLDEVVIDQEKWVVERCDRVMSRLKSSCSLEKNYIVVVPWLESFTAFTAPGEYIFFARALFQECANDEMAALIIAHEIAHHELGHLNMFPDFLEETISSELQWFVGSLMRTFQGRMYGPEQECDADRLAINMCIQAGYDPLECLKIFDKLEQMALDLGDIGGAYGPDEADDELAGDASLLTKMKIWLYHKKRGYLPIRDRREMLLEHVKESLNAA